MKLLHSQHPETSQPQEAVVITIGKMKFIVNEHFSDNGREIGELMERIAVEKCRKIS